MIAGTWLPSDRATIAYSLTIFETVLYKVEQLEEFLIIENV